MLLNKKVAIIITAWNQLEKTLSCLKTIDNQQFKPAEIILIDNGSESGFQKEISSKHPNVTLLASKENLGFAGGNNLGIKYALTKGFDYLFLLNNDTLLDQSCLQILVDTLSKSTSNIDAVSAKIYYAQEQDLIWTVGANFRPLLCEVNNLGKGQRDEGQWSKAQMIDFVPFCGLLFKCAVFEEVGLLDESYFLYYEDMDYCQRMRQKGKKLMLEPNAIIWHAVSSSSGGPNSAQALYWMARSSGRYFRKHGRGWHFMMIVPYRFASALRKTIKLSMIGKFTELKSYWSGLIDGWLISK